MTTTAAPIARPTPDDRHLEQEVQAILSEFDPQGIRALALEPVPYAAEARALAQNLPPWGPALIDRLVWSVAQALGETAESTRSQTSDAAYLAVAVRLSTQVVRPRAARSMR